ncbi:MAG: hypothetical protein IMY83_02200 [Chloroflexi bacterium]|nr:hypothetical protein [Chloroflexota bacterium]
MLLQPIQNGPQELELTGIYKHEQLRVAAWIAEAMLVQKGLIGAFTKSRAGTSEV